MATPIGHSIVGYMLARAAGVKSRRGMAMAMGAASLPDVDFLLGYVVNGDLFSLHHEVITHKPAFPLLVGAATGLAAAGLALLQGQAPTPRRVLRPAALAAALVGTHLAMDPMPLPYESTPPQWARIREIVVVQVWNMVVDLTVYGSLARLFLGGNETSKQAKEAGAGL